MVRRNGEAPDTATTVNGGQAQAHENRGSLKPTHTQNQESDGRLDRALVRYEAACHALAELFARKPREGWTIWGNEIPRDEFAEASPPVSNGEDDSLDIPPCLRRYPAGGPP